MGNCGKERWVAYKADGGKMKETKSAETVHKRKKGRKSYGMEEQMSGRQRFREKINKEIKKE